MIPAENPHGLGLGPGRMDPERACVSSLKQVPLPCEPSWGPIVTPARASRCKIIWLFCLFFMKKKESKIDEDEMQYSHLISP